MKKYTGQYIGKKVIPGDVLTKRARLAELKKLFERIKSRPWSVGREKTLGPLSTQIKAEVKSLQFLEELHKL